VRNSFKVHVPLQCAACPDTQASSCFDPDTGARLYGDPFSPFVLELALASHTGCIDSVLMFQLVECDLHMVSVRRRPQDHLRCVGCDSLLSEDGFARGSQAVSGRGLQDVRRERAAHRPGGGRERRVRAL